MLPESVVAGALALLAILFFVVRSAWDSRKLPRDRSAAGLPGALLAIGYAGLGAFVLVTIGYPVLFALGRLDLFGRSLLQLRFPGDTAVQLAGMGMLAAGLVLVFWSPRNRPRDAHDDGGRTRSSATRCTRATSSCLPASFP